ncbi:flagellar basal-body rod protein FlgF [Dethiobacter alkaliphilus]|uniref:Flagellar basal body rod protein n=1 Tax=Dethiobacter alkaliphilus AHT 1 TaxID=555088 RepID=C0GJF6_DETAL|nr:flagellar basal-body rod protein FlgF [Dethiobacter alkaliphilus]EEG76503.1 flagellar basal body rod protein [Dethiobacter alkaliphilus AHT 1]
MIRGLYTAASGMMVESTRQETITNNLANSETTGFKRDLALQRSHGEQPVVRLGDRQPFGVRPVIGSLGVGSLIDGIHTSHEQGSLQETGRDLDVAMAGDGYFVVETEQGLRYTRNGAFSIDADRMLVNDQGHRVMGTTGPLQLPAGEVQIDQAGNVFVNDAMQGQLARVSFADNSELQKVGDSLFTAAEGAEQQPVTGMVKQGFLEGSNVQAVQEMVQMLAAMRAYETNQRVVQAQDDMLRKATNEIAALR